MVGRQRAKNYKLKVSSDSRRPSSEDAVHRPRVGASAPKSLGMQFQGPQAPAVVIHENEDALLNIEDIIDPDLQSIRVKIY